MESIIQASRLHLEKRRAELHRQSAERRRGPQGESRSEAVAQRVAMIPLDRIREDPSFTNVRLRASSEQMDQLVESMRREGIKVPIEVVTTTDPEPYFYVRAGFRRTTAARMLRWKKIPAIVLPADTPVVDEYWTNIIENSSRSQLTTYEIACAARTMRSKFGIQGREFALRAGYSESYVGNLLRCIDRLPQEILDVWRDGAPIPVDIYHKWSSLRPEEAIREMVSYCGHHPKVVKQWRPPPATKEKAHPTRMASVTGLSRMQRLRFAAEAARALTDRERGLCLHVIDFCSGARDDVPEVYDGKQRAHQDQSRGDLAPPEDIDEAASLAKKPPRDG